jgi:ferredoxin
MPTITFKQSDKTLEVAKGEWLCDVCDRAGVPVPFSCRAGNCGSCATEVLEGADKLTPQTQREAFVIKALGLDTERYRLLCMTEIHGDVVLGRSAFTAPRPMY